MHRRNDLNYQQNGSCLNQQVIPIYLRFLNLMDQQPICPDRYMLVDGICRHYLFPMDSWTILGTIVLAIVSGLCTIAGLGGGSLAVVGLLIFFNYLPKDATLVAFCFILGASVGNASNLMQKAYNGKPLIQFHYAFILVPLMLAGSLIGVLLNKFLPSAVVCFIILASVAMNLKKTYNRLIQQHRKETSEMLNKEQGKQIISESKINPFEDEKNVRIFKNLGGIVIVVLILCLVRGSDKFPSLVGVAPCSQLFWIIYLLSFAIAIFFVYRNLQIIKSNNDVPSQSLGEDLHEIQQSSVDRHIKFVVGVGFGAGVYSGFGLGGGIFLVPLLRQIGCSPLQATSTSAFCILINGFINCILALSIGGIQVSELFYFVLVFGFSGHYVSGFVAGYLRRWNRLSYAEAILLILTSTVLINLPISLWKKYLNEGSEVIFGFGSVC